MPNIKISLHQETYGRLSDAAIRELRPIPWQILVLLRRSLGLPFPSERGMDKTLTAGTPEGSA